MTAAESGCADHKIRSNEIVFVLNEPIEADGESVFRLRGGDKRLADQTANNILTYDVQASSHKMGSLSKAKCVGRRSA